MTPLTADFTAYGASHLGAVGVLLAGAVTLVLVGRRLRDRDPRDLLGRALAVVMLLFTIPLQVLYFTPGYWNLQTTLPIQLCDLASLAAIYALLTHRRWAAGLTYYWGLTLTTQAIATPDLAADFPDPVFVLFWAMHIGTVWAAAHLTWGRGIRPDWRTYRFSVLITAVWAAAVFCLNLAVGTNYGYLNRKPNATTILDLLGPWPWYVLVEIAIIVAAWALVTWPWLRGRRATMTE